MPLSGWPAGAVPAGTIRRRGEVAQVGDSLRSLTGRWPEPASPRRQRRSAQPRPVCRVWPVRGAVFPFGEDVRDCHVGLRVEPLDVVLRCDVHLDVGVRAVVFHAPAHVIERERKLGLRGDCPVRQHVPGADADNAAPGTFADQLAEPELLERVAEDVAVRAGVLVGHRDQRPARRLVRVWLRCAPARERVCQPAACQPLQQQARYVAATVEPYVDDEPLAVILDQETPVELAEPGGEHVWDVHVPDASTGAFVHEAAVGPHPVAVTDGLLVGDRPYADRPRWTVATPYGQLHLLLGVVGEERARGDRVADRYAVDGEHLVARAYADTWPVERGRVVGRPHVTLQDTRDPVRARRVVHPVDAAKTWPVRGTATVCAAPLVRVRCAQLALKLPEQIAELGTRGDPVHQRQVTVVDLGPVHSRHILDPEVLPL